MKIDNTAVLDYMANASWPRAEPTGREVPGGGERKNSQSGEQMREVVESEEPMVSPSEILERIREVSQDGYYSVRFEKNMEFDKIVVKIVDRYTDEVIRELPPEDILRVQAKLTEYSGNIFKGVF